MTSPLDEGLALAGFELLTKLSSGGMGDVLLARRRGAHGFEKLLAIKTIRGELAKRPDIRAMFLDEARLCARLDHPAIAQVYDFGEQNELLFLAMEYVPGIALNKLLAKRGGPLPPAVAMRIVAEVCRGLHAAHELTDIDGSSLGVVHRDVSPGNLILTFEGRMKILDFGIAIMNGRESPDTIVGELKGKPSYMAPEHLRAERVDRRADIYSASVVLHELLTGRKLFTKETVVATVLAVESSKVAPPSSIAGPLPEGLDALVLKGLEKKVDDRFPDARTMAAALDKLIATTNGETLEAFVERELAAEREQHKAWLVAVLHAAASGAWDPSRTPTGQVRAVAILDQLGGAQLSPSGRAIAQPIPATSTMQVPATAPVPRGTSGSAGVPGVRTLVDPGMTVDGEVDSTSPRTPVVQRPKSKSAVSWLLIALLSFLGAFVGYRLAFRDVVVVEKTPAELAAKPGTGDVTTPKSGGEAALVKTATRAPGVQNAPTGDEAAKNDPSAPDAKKDKSAHAAKTKPKDVKKPEGAATPAHVQTEATTFGYVTIGAQPYALVRIDGQEVGVTPIMRRKLPTGAHEIQLVSPDSGEIRLKKTVTLGEGEHQRITHP